MEEIKVLENNEEVIENVVEEVVETGSKMSTLTGIGLGIGVVAAGYVIAKTAPKAIRFIRDKFEERRNNVEEDYITAEMREQMEDLEIEQD